MKRMRISPYFRNLRSAYTAEMDDLVSDSEGKNVLAHRLTQRRKEIGFLVNMMEVSPEMVTVVLHKAFRFKSIAVMEQLVAQEPEDLPMWDDIAPVIEMAPWSLPLVDTIRKQAMGDWFLSVAAGLEYLYDKPDSSSAMAQRDSDDDSTDGEKQDRAHDYDDQGQGSELLDDEEKEARDLEEAGADWMAEQGFDRKE
jgi:hypothetical protein